MATRLSIAAVLFAVVLVQSTAAFAAPQIHPPALAVYHDQDLSTDNPNEYTYVAVNGVDFSDAPASGSYQTGHCGTAQGGSFVIVRSGPGQGVVLRIGWNDTAVRVWKNNQVVLRLIPGTANRKQLTFQVCTPNGATANAAIAKWSYRHDGVPVTMQGLNVAPGHGFPLAIARAPSGAVWINEEFHRYFKYVGSNGAGDKYPVPWQPDSIFAFATDTFDGPAQSVPGGEDVVVDHLGRVWFSEAGTTPYGGTYRNHSRVVMFDPVTTQFSAYNIPGDNAGTFGLAWDAPNGRMWITQAVRSIQVGFAAYVAQPARITSFYPQYIQPDNAFDFPVDEACDVPMGQYVGACHDHPTRACITDRDCILADQVCAPNVGNDDHDCFHEHAIPDSNGAVVIPAHVMKHSDGTVWYSAYWGGNHLGRLDPVTDTFQVFPLPAPVEFPSCEEELETCDFLRLDPEIPDCSFKCSSYLLIGSGPWSVVEAANHDVLLSYQNQAAVGRFDYAHLTTTPADCTELNGSGANPCLTNHFLPPGSIDHNFQFNHSTALDAAGNAWLSGFTGPRYSSGCGGNIAMSYLQAGTNRMLKFPPLSVYPMFEPNPGGPTCPSFAATGLAYDPSTGGMYFAEYWRRRISRLTPLPD